MRRALFVIAVVVAASVSACALEEEATESNGGEAADEWVDPQDSTDIVEGHPDGEAAARAGCSVVEWCQAPGFDGTRCVQTGCSVSAAIAECIADVDFVCGGPNCPFIFTSITGARRTLPCP
jgi:hypothetical protein